MKRILSCFMILLSTCTVLTSCDLDSKYYPHNYGENEWIGDKYDARFYVNNEGSLMQDNGTIRLNGEVIEIVYLFIPGGGMALCHYRGDAEKFTYYDTPDDSFCSGNVVYDKEGKTFTMEVYETSDDNIPIGTIITFTRKID